MSVQGPTRPSVTFDLTPRDLEVVGRAWLHLTQRRTQTWLAAVGGLAVVAVLLWYVEGLVRQMYGSSAHLFQLLGALVAAMGLLYVLVWRWTRRVSGNLIKNPWTISVTPDGVLCETPSGSGTTAWDAVLALQEEKAHLAILIGPGLGYVVPRSAFDDAAHEAQFREAFARQLAPGRSEAIAKHRVPVVHVPRWATVALIAAIAFVWTAPWRASIDLGTELGSVEYLAFVVGDAADDAPLPMLVVAHQAGSMPEILRLIFRGYDTPARIVVPKAPYGLYFGNAWYHWDREWDEAELEAQHAGRLLAAFASAAAARYPTHGKPVVTGSLQGGAMAYHLAVRHSDAFSGVVPVGANLFEPLPDGAAPAIPIRALHGEHNDWWHVEHTRETVEAMQAAGWDVDLTVVPGAGRGTRPFRQLWFETAAAVLARSPSR